MGAKGTERRNGEQTWMPDEYNFSLFSFSPSSPLSSFSSCERENKRHYIIPTGAEREEGERESGIVTEG